MEYSQQEWKGINISKLFGELKARHYGPQFDHAIVLCNPLTKQTLVHWNPARSK